MDSVLFINSNNHVFEKAWPIGIMTLSSILKEHRGVECRIKDLPFIDTDESQSSQAWLDSLNVTTYRFVGFSTMCNTFPRSVSLAKTLATYYPEIPIVFGGPQASSVPISLLNAYSFIWAVVVGETEEVICGLWDDLTSSKYSERSGIIWSSKLSKKIPKACGNAPLPNLESLPFLNLDDYPPALDDQGLMLDVGRGCPYGCTFCTTNDFFHRKFRLKSKERIEKELRIVKENPRISRVDFVHDMFTANRRLVSEFCEYLIDRKTIVPWGCSSRTDTVTPDLLKMMVKAGCDDIFFGIETGSQRLQKLLKKRLNINEALQVLQTARDFGIGVTASLIMGFPQEEPQDLLDTLELAFKLDCKGLRGVQLHLLSPMAGTVLTQEYWEKLQYDGFISDVTSITSLLAWEESEIRKRKDLYSSFYYIPNKRIQRHHYKAVYTLMFYREFYLKSYSLILSAVTPRDLAKKIFDLILIKEGENFPAFDHKDHALSSLWAAKLLQMIIVSEIESSSIDKEFGEQIIDCILYEVWTVLVRHRQNIGIHIGKYDWLKSNRRNINGKRYLYAYSEGQITRGQVQSTALSYLGIEAESPTDQISRYCNLAEI